MIESEVSILANFIIEFPLRTEKYQEDILDKRFEVGRRMYNSLVSITQKRYKEMIKTKKYRDLLANLTGTSKKDKSVWKQIEDMRKQYGLSEYSFQADIVAMQHHFVKSIDSSTAQKIATFLWKSYSKFFYGNGKKIHYKKYGNFNSLEGKTNKSGIRFKNNHISWLGLDIPVIIDEKNEYEKQALDCDICFCRILRKYIRNRYKYYVQLILKGTPPVKFDSETGEIKRSIGQGDVGIDIGTSTVAISSKSDVKILELADKVQNIETQKRKLMRKLDRSRRATNPANYNEDGTIKKQGSKKVAWVRSNHYLKTMYQLKELCRKQADVRKYQHECLANYIVSLGDKVYVESMSFSGLQKRAKDTAKNDKGRFKRKKRFGKSIAHRAPALLLEIINRKLSYFGEILIKIDTYQARASQFNHFDQTYKKKKLSQRWNRQHVSKL